MNDKTIDAEVTTATATEPKENIFKKAWCKTKDFAKKNKKIVIGAAVGAAGTLAGLAYLGSKGMKDLPDDGEATIDINPMDESLTE